MGEKRESLRLTGVVKPMQTPIMVPVPTHSVRCFVKGSRLDRERLGMDEDKERDFRVASVFSSSSELRSEATPLMSLFS